MIAGIYEWEMEPATMTIGGNAIRVSVHLVLSGICASTVRFIAELGLADSFGRKMNRSSSRIYSQVVSIGSDILVLRMINTV